MRLSWIFGVPAAVQGLLVALPVGAQVRAFTGATIIDGNGGKPIANGVVLVEGSRITAVGTVGRVSITAGAERIDVSGK